MLGLAYEETVKVIRYYAEVAGQYDEGHRDIWWSVLYDGLTWEHVRTCLPEEGLVLDAGGGTGKWAIRMANSEPGLSIVLLDISRDMLLVARGKLAREGLEGRVWLVEADICAMPFRPGVFDFALAEWDPISYCDDPEEAVRELNRVLKPGSYVQAGVDSLFAIVRRLMREGRIDEAEEVLREGRFTSGWGFRWWVFTPRSLRELFEGAGFEVVRVSGKPVLSPWSEKLKEALRDEEKARKALELELSACGEPSIAGVGSHLHVVARKPY
ncbi:hypothetical protein DRO33_01350 [Candidatus Bathyarchaeota archaeon]|nr:MAG: hypothetical protein DRO33_01350 [Candidatus Bathyarchaeota archaeon]